MPPGSHLLSNFTPNCNSSTNRPNLRPSQREGEAEPDGTWSTERGRAQISGPGPYLHVLPQILLLLQHAAGVQRRLRHLHGLLRGERGSISQEPGVPPPCPQPCPRPHPAAQQPCAHHDPGVVHELRYRHALGRVRLQQVADQLLHCKSGEVCEQGPGSSPNPKTPTCAPP